MVQGAGNLSVRATILAFKRFAIAPEDQAKSLEKAWNRHRRKTGLDLYGKPPHHHGTGDRPTQT